MLGERWVGEWVVDCLHDLMGESMTRWVVEFRT